MKQTPPDAEANGGICDLEERRGGDGANRADPTTGYYHETTKPPGWGANLGAVGRFTVRNRRGCCSDTLLQITGVDKINALKEGAVDLGVRRDQHFVDQCF